MSLRWRLTAVIGGVVALMLFAASFLSYISAERELHNQVDAFLLDRSRETELGLDALSNLPLASSQARDGFQVATISALTRPDASIQLVQLVSDNGERRALQISGGRLPVLADDLTLATVGEDGRRARKMVDRDVDGVGHRILISSNERGALMVGRSMEDVHKTLDGLRGWLIVISISGSLAAALVGWVVAHRVLRPVSRLAAATKQVAETRRFDADLRVEGNDELGALARSFNSMLSTLRASRDQQERLVRDANHEMRTPLTSLRTNVDVLRRRVSELEEGERDSIIEEMDSEVRELTMLVTELVGFATHSGSLSPASFVAVDLVELSREAALRTYRRTGRTITVDGVDSAMVMGDLAGLERAIGNLVGNAVKFTAEGSPIEIVVGACSVEVLDRGPGIAPDELSRVFDRFYRSDATRTMPGSGLGLAIVAEIAFAHGGEAFAKNRGGRGAIVGFSVAADLPSLTASGG